jgi:hypothetical protein
MSELERLRLEAIESLPTIYALASRVRSIAWWPKGGDPARPRVVTTPRPATPSPGDFDLVLAYRAMTQELARAHAWLYDLPPSSWIPARVLYASTEDMRVMRLESVRDVGLEELRSALLLLRAKLATPPTTPRGEEHVRGASSSVLDALERYPLDVRRAPAGWTPPRRCACGCERLVGDRRGRLSQVCANRRARERKRVA